MSAGKSSPAAAADTAHTTALAATTTTTTTTTTIPLPIKAVAPGPFWRVELSAHQRTFVVTVIIIAIAVAACTLIFGGIWCVLDQDGFCQQFCQKYCLGTPKDTFSPQRWWMEALAQRVENLEAEQPLMERRNSRKKVGIITHFEHL